MSLLLEPIGYFRTTKKYPFEAARQAGFDLGAEKGFIELLPQKNYEQALQGLAGCSHLWVIYQFHLNSTWNPVVQPPRGPKQGVFATRSPHRPNPLGLSALEIGKIEGLRIEVFSHDLLDGTPIFDLKPYHPDIDSIPHAHLEWVEQLKGTEYQIQFSDLAQRQLAFLEQHQILELRNFLTQQLGSEPLNTKKKRVFEWQKRAVIAYRTWRALFLLEDKTPDQIVKIELLYSGYSPADLLDSEDPYEDKALHREFQDQFPDRGDLPRFKV